jgi:hypothetical protein
MPVDGFWQFTFATPYQRFAAPPETTEMLIAQFDAHVVNDRSTGVAGRPAAGAGARFVAALAFLPACGFPKGAFGLIRVSRPITIAESWRNAHEPVY